MTLPSTNTVFRIPPVAGASPPDRPTTVVLFDDLGRGSLDMSYTWNEYGRLVYTLDCILYCILYYIHCVLYDMLLSNVTYTVVLQ